MQIIFHIGIHKTATTWLQLIFFTKHPEIALLNEFITPWDDELIRYLVNPGELFSPSHYRDIIKKKIDSKKIDTKHIKIVISSERLAGHPYSGGYDREQIARRIAQAFPEAKIMITIRNQVDIIFSMYQQMVKEGYLGKIEDMLNENCWKQPCFTRVFFNYFQLFELYADLFKKPNIGLFRQEQLSSNVDLFTSNICEFLEVDPYMFSSNSQRIAQGITQKKISAMRLMNHFRRSDYNLYPLIKVNSKSYKIFVKIVSLFCRGKLEKKLFVKSNARKIQEYYLQSNIRIFNEVLDNVANTKEKEKYGIT